MLKRKRGDPKKLWVCKFSSFLTLSTPAQEQTDSLLKGVKAYLREFHKWYRMVLKGIQIFGTLQIEIAYI